MCGNTFSFKTLLLIMASIISSLISAKVIVSSKLRMHFKLVVLFVAVDIFVSCVN